MTPYEYQLLMRAAVSLQEFQDGDMNNALAMEIQEYLDSLPASEPEEEVNP